MKSDSTMCHDAINDYAFFFFSNTQTLMAEHKVVFLF